jgi:hypothetical protein
MSLLRVIQRRPNMFAVAAAFPESGHRGPAPTTLTRSNCAPGVKANDGDQPGQQAAVPGDLGVICPKVITSRGKAYFSEWC